MSKTGQSHTSLLYKIVWLFGCYFASYFSNKCCYRFGNLVRVKRGVNKKVKMNGHQIQKKLIYLLFASPGPRTASTLPAPSSPSARAAVAKRTTPARTQVPAAARYRHHLQPATIIYQTPQNSVQSSRTTVFTLHRVTVVQGHRPLCSLTIPL